MHLMWIRNGKSCSLGILYIPKVRSADVICNAKYYSQQLAFFFSFVWISFSISFIKLNISNPSVNSEESLFKKCFTFLPSREVFSN